jgi:hypothetical protein
MRAWTERDAAHAIRGLDDAPVRGACCGGVGADEAPAPAAKPAAKMLDMSAVDCRGYWWYRWVPTGSTLAVGGFVLGLGVRAYNKLVKP